MTKLEKEFQSDDIQGKRQTDETNAVTQCELLKFPNQFPNFHLESKWQNELRVFNKSSNIQPRKSTGNTS